jgi:hypothetical protein
MQAGGHEWSSEAIRGHQRPSVVDISGTHLGTEVSTLALGDFL